MDLHDIPSYPLGPIPRWLEKFNISVGEFVQSGEVPRFVSDEVAHHMFRRLEKCMPDQPVGLLIAQSCQLSDIGLAGLIAQHSLTLREAQQRYLSYRSLSRTGSVRFEHDPESQTDSLIVDPVLREGWDDTNEWRQTYPFVLGLALLRAICGDPEMGPQRVQFTFENRRFQGDYEAFFGCPVFLGCADDRLVFSHEVCEQTIVDANPATRPYLEQLAISERKKVSENVDFLDLVRVELRKAIVAKDFDQEAIARRLSMSKRVMQRRLGEYGVSFRTLVEATQKELALEMLSTPHHSIHEIAFKLGYSQATSFHRAFKRWTGKSPNEMRDELIDTVRQ